MPAQTRQRTISRGGLFSLLLAACAVDAYLLSVLASDYFERGGITSGVFAFLAFTLLGFLMVSVIKLGQQLLGEKFRKPETDKRGEVVNEPGVSETTEHDPTFVFIKAGNKIYKVSFDAVLYAEASGNHTKIVLEDNVIKPAMTFTSLEGLLPARLFARLHRSFMVNTAKITHIEGNRVFIGKIEIPIGSNYREAFLRRMGID